MPPAVTRDDGYARVQALVERFENNLDYYRSYVFDETSNRASFIDPLFEALGWDVNDNAGKGPDRDVILNARVALRPTVAGETAWDDDLALNDLAEREPEVQIPDYTFRVTGETRFFVEAKKPTVNLRSRAPTFQVKSYAWSQQVAIGVLTDFEEFRVFLCRTRPDYDRPDEGILGHFDLRYSQYADNWNQLWELLSRQAVAAGSLAPYIRQTTRKTRGTLRVDQAFLAELSEWRERIAADLAQRNIGLSPTELADATQRILDRVVFVRACEDRDIEPRPILRGYARRTDAYARITQEFGRLNTVYNGALFAPHFSEDLELSDQLFQNLIASLYFPRSPYRFDVIGPELLGSVYERFLGKRVTISEDGAVSFEEKLEVRHAGGVYYTPRWVVDTIVDRILSPKLAGRTPRAAANLRIVDPACGSGSFLIGALDWLIRWHEHYYQQHPHQDAASHYRAPDGSIRLTTEAKADLLSSCIYGVDIDPQAVEITQMSLYLKVLEEESAETLQRHQRLFHSTVLPPMDKNIRCGNALISPGGVPARTFDDLELARRLNPFDWWHTRHGFGAVFSERGGFDAVIGNPPYTRIQVLQEFYPDEVSIYASRYESASYGSFDISTLFVERSFELMRDRIPRGNLGFIITRQIAEADYGRPLRQMLSSRDAVSEIIDFGSGTVFEDASAYTLILLAGLSSHEQYQLTRVSAAAPSLAALETAEQSALSARLPAASLGEHEWDLSLPAEAELLARLSRDYPTLEEVADGHIFQGVITGADVDVYRLIEVGPHESDDTLALVRTERMSPEDAFPIEKELLRLVYAGRADLRRFRAGQPSWRLLFPYVRQHPGEDFRLLTASDGFRAFARLSTRILVVSTEQGETDRASVRGVER